MPEEYREYRRRRTSSAHKHIKKCTFFKKLGYQTVISIVLLITVCTVKFSFTDSIVNTYIKNAVLYQPDTSGLADMFDNIMNLYTNEDNNNEENTTTENL